MQSVGILPGLSMTLVVSQSSFLFPQCKTAPATRSKTRLYTAEKKNKDRQGRYAGHQLLLQRLQDPMAKKNVRCNPLAIWRGSNELVPAP